MWSKGKSVYRWLNALSLDVAAGACISSLAVGKVFGIELTWSVWLALGVVVWLIYTLDHLLDARKITHQAHTYRHVIHQKNFKTITAIALFVSVCSIALLFFLPKITLLYGTILLALVVIYFLLLKMMRIKMAMAKELFIAFIYTAGIFVGPVSLYKGAVQPEIYLLILEFFFLALINLLEFSIIERHSDRKDGHLSLVNALGVTATKQIIWILITTMSLLMVATVIMNPAPMVLSMQWVILMMWLTLVSIQSFTKFYSIEDRYRLVGDLIFMYPLILLI